MIDLSHILLMSDIDGTLIGSDYQIPPRNLEAIRRFQEQGGSFAIATGRSVLSGGKYAELTHTNGPCVCLNGGLVYDYKQEKVLLQYPMEPVSAGIYMNRIFEKFPSLGMECFGLETVLVLRDNALIQKHLEHEEAAWEAGMRLDASRPWFKALFMGEPEVKSAAEAYAQTFPHEEVRFVSSSDNYLEMLPAQVDKGSAMREAARLIGFSPENVFAIGDYYNDAEMLAAAGMAAVTANAPDDIKRMADILVGDCENGAVADLIEWIERREKERQA